MLWGAADSRSHDRGDFAPRFREADVLRLMEIINRVRRDVWKQQPEAFFRQAILDATARLPRRPAMQAGMDMSYKGLWAIMLWCFHWPTRRRYIWSIAAATAPAVSSPPGISIGAIDLCLPRLSRDSPAPRHGLQSDRTFGSLG